MTGPRNEDIMLKKNVITKTYQITLRTPTGKIAVSTLDAESEACARDRVMVPYGWQIVEVTPCEPAG